jgi:hypothetical protein
MFIYFIENKKFFNLSIMNNNHSIAQLTQWTIIFTESKIVSKNNTDNIPSNHLEYKLSEDNKYTTNKINSKAKKILLIPTRDYFKVSFDIYTKTNQSTKLFNIMFEDKITEYLNRKTHENNDQDKDTLNTIQYSIMIYYNGFSIASTKFDGDLFELSSDSDANNYIIEYPCKNSTCKIRFIKNMDAIECEFICNYTDIKTIIKNVM